MFCVKTLFIRLFAPIVFCLMAGCAHEIDTSPPPAPKTTTTGAIIGAVGGSMASPPVAAAVVVGTVAGAAIGNYLEKQAPKTLPYQIQNSGIQLYRVGDKVTLVLPADQFFEYKATAIKPYSYVVLNKVVAYLKQERKESVKIAAFTDNEGTPERNYALSQAWAENMAKYLWDHGIDARLLYAVGRGECCSVANNTTAKGQALNRRIEITYQSF